MIDPEPFVAAMPQPIRDAIAAGSGFARAWLSAEYPSRQIDAALEALRSHEEAALAGWLAGMTMFIDTKRVIAGVIERERLYEPIPFILDAFAAGIRAAVPTTKRQWQVIERLVARNTIASASFCAMLPIAVCVESPIAREHASRIAALLGDPAREALAAARTSASYHDTKRLDAALATVAPPVVETSSESELLRRLLDAWRATHDPALEAPIARLGRILAARRGPLQSRTGAPDRTEIEGLWQRAVRERIPGDLDVLLDTPCVWHYLFHARIERLGKWPPDPRMARLLDIIAMFDNATVSEGYPGLLTQVTEHLLPHLVSPSLAPTLDAMARTRPATAAALAPIRAAISRTTVRAADPALLVEAQAATGGYQRIEQLFADVAANPRDWAPRHVLADALQAASDPRGEYIALQLAIADGATDPAVHARAALLGALHFDTWTAALPSVERDNSRFERGFPSAVATNGDGGSLAYSCDRPEWATVEKLAINAREVDLAPLVRRLPLLRSLTCARRESLEQLAAAGWFPQLRALGATDEWMPDELRAFPNVRVVGSYWWNDPFARFRDAIRRANELGLEAIVWFMHELRNEREALACFDGSLELRFGLQRRLQGGFTPTGWLVVLPRTGPARIAWDGDPGACAGGHEYELSSLLSTVKSATGISRFEVYLPLAIAKRQAALDTARTYHDIELGRPIDLAEV